MSSPQGKRLDELYIYRRAGAWKYGVDREEIFLKALAQNLLHSAFKCLMKQSLQTEPLSGKTLRFCGSGDSSLCCIKVGESDKVFVQYFLLRCIDFCIKM